MVIGIIDCVLFLLLGLPILYLLVFALFSRNYRLYPYPVPEKQLRFVTLIPAYKADSVIERTVMAALGQSYPKVLHEVVVIADRMQPETLSRLWQLPVKVLNVEFENSSKAKALNHAVTVLGADAADAVMILDADNLVSPNALFRFNEGFNAGMEAMQGHRTAKNRDTSTAVLDAASEEINNSIFRRGHVAAGFSSALIGSGMAFRYNWFRDNIQRCTTSGEDKELEALLLEQQIFIDYLDDVVILDEKVQGGNAYYNQRRRWIAAQFYAFGKALGNLPRALLAGNFDYCDKLIQWCLPPRMLLIGLTPLWAVIVTCLYPLVSIKWWALLLFFGIAMIIALPDDQKDPAFKKALFQLPKLVVLTVANLFRLGGTKNRFIHTEHTGAEDQHTPLP